MRPVPSYAVEVTFFGTRGSCPCSGSGYQRYGGNTSCVLVRSGDGDPLILDLGTGLRALGAQLAPQLAAQGTPLRATALLTHLHYDHVLGLPFFSPLQDPGAVLEVFGPSPAAGPLAEVLPTVVQPPFFPVQLKEFRGSVNLHEIGQDVLDGGWFKATGRAVDHPGPTLGYRVEADGATLAYLPDHQAPLDRQEVARGVHEICDGADLLIHDAQYSDEEFAAFPDWGHSTIAYAVQVAVSCKVRNLVLFHHDPSHDDGEIDRLLAMARSLPGADALESIVAAEEGMAFELGV